MREDTGTERQDRLENGIPHPDPLSYGRGQGESSSGFSEVHAAHSSASEPKPAAPLAQDTPTSREESRVGVFSKLGQRLSAAESAKEAAKTIVRAAEDLLGWDACSFSLYSGGEKLVQEVFAVETVGDRLVVAEPEASKRTLSAVEAKVIAEGGQLILKEGAGDPHSEGSLLAASAGSGEAGASMLAVPIRNGDQVIGVLSIHSKTPGAYSRESLDLLQALADYCGGAIERIRAQTAEREALTLLKKAQEVANLGSWSSGMLPGKALSWSSEVFQIFGISETQFSGKVQDFFERVHPEDRPKLLAAREAALERGVPFDLDHRIVRPDGDIRWVHEKAEILRDGLGRPERMLGIVQDITERKRAEQSLRRSEERWKIIFEYAPDAYYLHDLTGTFVHGNQAAERLVGCERHELLGKNLVQLNLLDADGLVQAKEMLARNARGFATGPNEYRIRRKDGEWLVVEVHTYPVEIDNQVLVLGIARDVSQRKRTEAELFQSERRLRELMENIRLVAIMLDIGGRILFANRFLLELAGYAPEEVMGKDWLSVFVPADQTTTAQQAFNALMQGTLAAHNEYEIVARNGERHLIAWNNTFLRNPSGETIGISSIGEDITERRRLEEQYRQSQKMEAIGQLAGGVAHDFNNILAASLMQVGLLQQRADLPADILTVFKELEKEIARGANLTRQLLLFSRRQVANFEPLDINAVIANLLKMLRRLLGENIEIGFTACHEPVWAKADPGMIEQVVMNLCVNARDAMPRGGQLALATTLSERTRDSARTHRDARPGRFVCLQVSDTGCGIPDSILPHIYEPFFTTKPIGKGTGLGLATVYGIVKQHDGWIEVDTTAGKGSSFRVFLPALDKPAEPAPTGQAPEAMAGGSESILLVEDELTLRLSASLCLSKLGYQVVEAADANEALHLWEMHQGKFNLLLTDMVMPGSISGLDLALKLKQHKRDLKVILSSGYSADLLEPGSSAWQQFIYLPKPYPVATLAKTVRRCLDEGRD